MHTLPINDCDQEKIVAGLLRHLAMKTGSDGASLQVKEGSGVRRFDFGATTGNTLLFAISDRDEIRLIKESTGVDLDKWKATAEEWIMAFETKYKCLIKAVIPACYPPISAAPAPANGVIEAVTTIFERQLLKQSTKHAADDQWQSIGRANFQAWIREYIAAGQPILFALPAFPFKSKNTETKVVGDLPDMGEKLALQRLVSFTQAVERVYNPGARIIIFTDGLVFNDILAIPDTTVDAYQEALTTLQPSESVIFTGIDFFFADLTNEEKRDALDALFGPTLDDVDARIKADADYNKVYCAFKHFFAEELQLRPGDLSRRQKDAVLGTVSRRLMQRNWSYGELVKVLFGHAVRLSVHPLTNAEKFGIRLVGDDDWGTPWHNVALKHADGSGWSMVRRNVAEAMGCKLEQSQEGLAYFVEPTNGKRSIGA